MKSPLPVRANHRPGIIKDRKMTEHTKLTYKEDEAFAIVSGFGGCLYSLYLPKKMAKELVHRYNSYDALLASDEERKSYALTIKKIWAALGIMDYKAADGKSIDELVLLIKRQRDALLIALIRTTKYLEVQTKKQSGFSNSRSVDRLIEDNNQVLAEAEAK